jgi:hypothetical protein
LSIAAPFPVDYISKPGPRPPYYLVALPALLFGHVLEDRQKMDEQVVLYLLIHFLTFLNPSPVVIPSERRHHLSGDRVALLSEAKEGQG